MFVAPHRLGVNAKQLPRYDGMNQQLGGRRDERKLVVWAIEIGRSIVFTVDNLLPNACPVGWSTSNLKCDTIPSSY